MSATSEPNSNRNKFKYKGRERNSRRFAANPDRGAEHSRISSCKEAKDQARAWNKGHSLGLERKVQAQDERKASGNSAL